MKDFESVTAVTAVTAKVTASELKTTIQNMILRAECN